MAMSPGAMTPQSENLSRYGTNEDPLYSLLIATYGYHGHFGSTQTQIIGG